MVAAEWSRAQASLWVEADSTVSAGGREMIVTLPPVDPESRAVGERLRRIREARGLEQAEIAGRMGVRREVLARAERGRERLTSGQLYAASLALRIPMRLLFEESLDLGALRRL